MGIDFLKKERVLWKRKGEWKGNEYSRKTSL